jgi:hypothetical protein
MKVLRLGLHVDRTNEDRVVNVVGWGTMHDQDVVLFFPVSGFPPSWDIQVEFREEFNKRFGYVVKKEWSATLPPSFTEVPAAQDDEQEADRLDESPTDDLSTIR